LLCCSSLFFFYSYLYHRSLPSFPTRRSSDLVQCVVSPGGSPCVRATTRAATSGPSGGMRAGRVLSRRSPTTPSCAKRSCQRQTRSEEHTSELQSQSNLVCRLLLEKKNKPPPH